MRTEEVTFQACQFQQRLPNLKLQWFYELESHLSFVLTFCRKKQVWGNSRFPVYM